MPAFFPSTKTSSSVRFRSLHLDAVMSNEDFRALVRSALMHFAISALGYKLQEVRPMKSGFSVWLHRPKDQLSVLDEHGWEVLSPHSTRFDTVLDLLRDDQNPPSPSADLVRNRLNHLTNSRGLSFLPLKSYRYVFILLPVSEGCTLALYGNITSKESIGILSMLKILSLIDPAALIRFFMSEPISRLHFAPTDENLSILEDCRQHLPFQTF